MRGCGQLWAIVLAGGEGTRLAELTRALYGEPLPKQFAALTGQRSLLQETLARTAAIVPAARTLVVVGEAHAVRAREQLGDFPEVALVVQPRNLGTGPGILLPLARVRARDPQARVAVLPSDHHVPQPGPFLDALELAASPARGPFAPLVLLGVRPSTAESDYGWIVPGRPVPGESHLRTVRRFVEKPAPEITEQLLHRGALWNTFAQAGPLATFWHLCARHLPSQTHDFAVYSHHVDSWAEAPLLEALYARMAPADFSHAVLERSEELLVARVDGSDWCDWGSSARVLRSLDGTEAGAQLRERLAAFNIGDPHPEIAHPRRIVALGPAGITRSLRGNYS